MAIRMSDANDTTLCNRISSSDSSSSDSSKTHFDFKDFGVLSCHKLQNLISSDKRGVKTPLMQSLEPLDRHRYQCNPFANMSEDKPLPNGWNSNNGWNSDNSSDQNNEFNWSNGCHASQCIGNDSDPNARPGMRAIRKNSVSDTVYTTAPIDSDNRGNKDNKDWYKTFVEQTQRFAQMNGKSQKYSDEKHVHFQDDDDSWDIGTNDNIRDTNYNLIDSSNDFDDEKDLNGSAVEENVGDWRSDSANNASNRSYSFPRTSRKGSVMDSFCNDILRPVADNLSHNSQYMAQQWNQNMSHIQTALNNSTIFGDSIWGNPSNPNNSIYRIFNSTLDDGKSKLQKLLTSVRKVMPKNVAPNYTWSGQLPRRIRTKTPVYSCKVFLGGIPYDLTDSDLHCTFAQFGHIQIQWPGKDIRSAIEGAAANKAGYVYIIFETYDNVSALLNSCTISYRDMDSGCRWYYSISSRRQKSKEVQVIPFDIGDRFYMKSSFSGQMEHSRTVFVGALHGMLAADGLAKVMDDLFAGVIFAGLDTDKHKYPLGSGRVTFDNQESYLKAVSAAFVEIKSARFKKKIQIDPYIESESMCAVCRAAIQNPIYCREEGLYFCAQCWQLQHSDQESANHRPIVKNKSSKT